MSELPKTVGEVLGEDAVVAAGTRSTVDVDVPLRIGALLDRIEHLERLLQVRNDKHKDDDMNAIPKTAEDVFVINGEHSQSDAERYTEQRVQRLLERIAHLENLLQVQNAELESLRKRTMPDTRTTT